jgi:hypothetical protein
MVNGLEKWQVNTLPVHEKFFQASYAEMTEMTQFLKFNLTPQARTGAGILTGLLEN